MSLRYLIFFLFAAGAYAASPTPSETARIQSAETLAKTLKPQSGSVELKGGSVKLTLPSDFRYLSPNDSEIVLHQIWGNPLAEKPLGMIVPADFDPLIDGGWAVVITYSNEGHIRDDDAAKIDYQELLAKMKKGVQAANEERAKQGYRRVELVGWAATPRYDAFTHKLYWAKEIKFGQAKQNTLNYFIRILGRTGVLELNAVARISDLPAVEAVTPKILAAVDFQPGNRYADFKESTDKVATYGVAALIAGGVAAKAGFFKLLWVGILAFKKLIIVGALAVAGWFKKLFGRKRAEVQPRSFR